ncbi:MAG: hypothetical protein WDN31_22805 [Hyphomicrobium sp.]
MREELPSIAANEEPAMNQDAEPLYDDITMHLMSDAYEAADKEVGASDRALQVTMAVAIIRAINKGERDLERLTALAISAVRVENNARPKKDNPVAWHGWVDLTALLG